MLTKVLLSCGVSAALGCSHVGITAPTGEEVVGRTMEAGYGGIVDHADWLITKVPAGTMMQHTSLSMACYGAALPGYMVKYNTVGISLRFEDQYVFSDGMNDQGLTVGAHVLHETVYEPIPTDPAELAKSICYSDVNGWLLGHFASIAEMREKIGDYHVVYNPLVPLQRVMFTVADAAGEHAVLEWLGGKLNIVDNKVKLVTNDPPHDWHLRNLVNYMQVSDQWADRSSIEVETHLGPVPVQTAHGVNLGGLPGDATPPARFARMFYLRQYANLVNPMKNLGDAINLVTAVLNSVYIPKGAVASKGGEPAMFDAFVNATRKAGVQSAVTPVDYTEWSAIKVPQSLQYLLRTYMNSQWRMIDLHKVRWGCKVSSQPLFEGNGIADITRSLRDESQ